MQIKTQLTSPIRPVRLLRTFLGTAISRVPAFAAVGMGMLLLGALVFGSALGEGALATLGTWSLSGVLGCVGLVGGALVGFLAAAKRTLVTAESDLRTWLERLPREGSERLFPSISLGRLKSDYQEAVDQMFERTLGHLPVPRFARGIIKSRFRHAIVEDFFEHCERAGTSVVGIKELANYVAATGMPIATAPVHAQLQFWNVLLVAVLGALFAIPLLAGVGGGSIATVNVVLGTFFGLALLLLIWKLPRASLHRNPWNYRLGIGILALCLAAWPVLYVQLWSRDIGMVWIAVLAATLWTFNLGVRQAAWEADR